MAQHGTALHSTAQHGRDRGRDRDGDRDRNRDRDRDRDRVLDTDRYKEAKTETVREVSLVTALP
jgi:hypothetical protein